MLLLVLELDSASHLLGEGIEPSVVADSQIPGPG